MTIKTKHGTITTYWYNEKWLYTIYQNGKEIESTKEFKYEGHAIADAINILTK